MPDTINIYCDESCHLLNDHHKSMILGAVWCSRDKRREICDRLREIKSRHGIAPDFEVKWGKVSPAKVQFYSDWLGLFLREDDLHFRAVIVPDKTILDHASHGQTHDDWYYKMYFQLLSIVLKPSKHHKIFIDQKDTHSARKVRKLHDVLCHNAYDFDRQIIELVQVVPSHDSDLIQLADLLIGAVSYANRGLSSNAGKSSLVAQLRQATGLSLTKSTLLSALKVNLLVWKAA